MSSLCYIEIIDLLEGVAIGQLKIIKITLI